MTDQTNKRGRQRQMSSPKANYIATWSDGTITYFYTEISRNIRWAWRVTPKSEPTTIRQRACANIAIGANQKRHHAIWNAQKFIEIFPDGHLELCELIQVDAPELAPQLAPDHNTNIERAPLAKEPATITC